MTKDEGIALLTRIYEVFSSRIDFVTISLVYSQAATLLAERTWHIAINGWIIENEEDWEEYKVEHAVLETE
jgi:uncharacterized membrane protein YecN with MAPEG domain